MIYIFWVIWVSWYFAMHSWKQKHALKHWDNKFIIYCCKPLFYFYFLTSSSPVFNQLSNWGLGSQGFIFTLAVIMPAPLCSCLHSRNHTHITSAKKCLLYVCMCVCVGVCGGGEGVEGVEYLPWGGDKVTEGRQWTPKQWQTCQDRIGLTAESE